VPAVYREPLLPLRRGLHLEAGCFKRSGNEVADVLGQAIQTSPLNLSVTYRLAEAQEQHPPAVHAGISDHVWTVEEVAKLADSSVTRSTARNKIKSGTGLRPSTKRWRSAADTSSRRATSSRPNFSTAFLRTCCPTLTVFTGPKFSQILFAPVYLTAVTKSNRKLGWPGESGTSYYKCCAISRCRLRGIPEQAFRARACRRGGGRRVKIITQSPSASVADVAKKSRLTTFSRPARRSRRD
jgi:hypothetical protein